MITDEQYAHWLRDDRARRTVLLEIDTDPPRRLSVVPYTTLPTDPLPNLRYDAVVQGGVGYTESLALDGSSRASYANITLSNEDGSLDGWLSEVWRNRAIRVYYGDVAWPRDDYRLVAAGVVDRLDTRRGSLSIVLLDAAARLDAAVTDQLLGGPGQDAERLAPTLLGECHNVTPALYNPAQHEYRAHGGALERVIEVRDNGVPVGHAPIPVEFTPVPGGFRLTADPAGTVTASVQGDVRAGEYRNRVAPLVQLLATAYGPASSRFAAADLDAGNLAAFDAAHPQAVGTYLPDRATVLAVIVDLAASVGAQLSMSRLGKLRLLKVQLPPTGEPTRIMPHDYEHGSLEIAGQTVVRAGVRLGYCRQWTPGQQIAEGVPSEHRDLYAQDWLTAVARAPGVAETYRIEQEGEQENTLLLDAADAQAEAARRLALWSVPRTVFRVRGTASLLQLELGAAVTLYGDRFGLDAGRTGQIVGLKPDWTTGRVDVEVLI